MRARMCFHIDTKTYTLTFLNYSVRIPSSNQCTFILPVLVITLFNNGNFAKTH